MVGSEVLPFTRQHFADVSARSQLGKPRNIKIESFSALIRCRLGTELDSKRLSGCSSCMQLMNVIGPEILQNIRVAAAFELNTRAQCKIVRTSDKL
jgi:hypothetical protein